MDRWMRLGSMSMSLDGNAKSFVLSPEDASRLAKALPAVGSVAPVSSGGALLGNGSTIELPPSVFSFLLTILQDMAGGNSIFIASTDAELTTQQAADLLNVSRPFFIALLERGELPYRTVGRYRRVKFKDVLNYQSRLGKSEDAAVEEMIKHSQQLGMPY
jgi:excisionase family DNA binding protein